MRPTLTVMYIHLSLILVDSAKAIPHITEITV